MANKKPAAYNISTDSVRCGTINLYQKGALKKNKAYYAMLMATSQSGVARLDMYENDKHSVTMQPSLMIVGSDVVKVERVTLQDKDMRNAFLISIKEHHYTFFVASSVGCDAWVKDIRETLLGEVFATNSPKDQKMISEVNEIYEAADQFFPQTKEFLVTIDEKTRGKMGVDGMVRLVVENDCITIISSFGKKIVRWALKDLRKFSYQNNFFIVEAGRKSPLGEGNFSFHTDEGERIVAMIDMRKRVLKQRLDTTYHAGPESTQVPGHHSALKPPPPPASCPSFMGNSNLYDMKNVHPLQKVENKAESLAKSTSPHFTTKNTKFPIVSTCIQSSVKQHPCKVTTMDETLNQGRSEIYSEPQIIKNAWKSHGFSDSEDTEMYSNLSHQKKEEDHYWRGSDIMPSVDTEKEDIYSVVDYSKKKKKT